MRLVDSQGKHVILGNRIGGGGEGTVYKVEGKPNLVAKVYTNPAPKQKARKLETMVRLKSDPLITFTTWLLELLSDAANLECRGFLMPIAGNGREIHKLYSPKSRQVEFQSVDWRFLIHAASNVARAFAAIHNSNLVIGDVNHSSVMIAPDATVKLIDCDSFQVLTGREQFLCEVGEPEHTPPELQGKAFNSVIRLPAHDNFGLAILIFRLLFMGRHPFAGEYLGSGDLSQEQKIASFRFAYGPSAANRQMRQPPGTLDLQAVSDPVAKLFEQAFSQQASLQLTRPTAEQWVRSLNELLKKLVPCRSDPSHYALSTLPACPWCAIESKSSVRLFQFAFSATAAGGKGFNLALVWQSIQGVPLPGQVPSLTAHKMPVAGLSPGFAQIAAQQQKAAEDVAALVPVANEAKTKLMARNVFLGGIFVGTGLIAWAINPALIIAGIVATFLVIHAYEKISTAYKGIRSQVWAADSVQQQVREQANKARRDLETRLALAKSKAGELYRRWNSPECSEDLFTAKLKELQVTKQDYELLPSLRDHELNRLKARARELQLERHLDRFHIVPGLIPGIGRSRCITLDRCGIWTAGDLGRVEIPSGEGLGPALIDALMDWRREVECNFIFNPNAALDPADVQRVDSLIYKKRSGFEAVLSGGPAALRQIAQDTFTTRRLIHSQYSEVLQEMAQIQADLRALL